MCLSNDLLKTCKAIKIGLSVTLEQTLIEKLANENTHAVRAYNEFVDEHSCFSDEFREF